MTYFLTMIDGRKVNALEVKRIYYCWVMQPLGSSPEPGPSDVCEVYISDDEAPLMTWGDAQLAIMDINNHPEIPVKAVEVQVDGYSENFVFYKTAVA